MTQVVCSNVTLTASFAAMNASPVALEGSWAENKSGGALTLLVKHVKHASESGGYPVIRLVWGYSLADGTAATAHDPQVDPNITSSSGVATVVVNTGIATLTGLTDSDGARWLPVQLDVPRFATTLTLEAKQAGDTTNFGKLYAQLTGKI